MRRQRGPATLVIAEDDDDDCLLLKEALKRAGVTEEPFWVKNGEELLALLRRRGDAFPGDGGPVLILLDLNMPKMDGREALQELKSDPSLRRIPVIVMTTSQADEDIQRCYDLGVCSYIRKPTGFEELVEAVRLLQRYWLELVELPLSGASGAGVERAGRRRPSPK